MFRFLTSLLNLKTTPPTKEPLSQGPRLEDMRGGKGKRRRATESEFTSYYGRPVVKKAHWVWPIWFYFWVGGIAGGASAVAALAELFGDKEDSSIVRTGHYISLAGLIASPVLLIIDLQRPERFHHMLRILKLRSPLSLGTYILTSAGFLSGLNAAGQIVEDGLIVSKDSWPGKLVLALSSRETRALQGIDGLALGGYTGTLLSATAVPLWADMNELISPLFVSSALSTGSAAIALARALNGTPTHELHRLDPIEQIAITSELSLIGASLLRLKPQTRRFLYENWYGKLNLAAVGVGMIVPLLLQLLSPKKGPLVRPLNILSSLMVLSGGLCLRIGLVEAGKASSDSPDAYHAITRR